MFRVPESMAEGFSAEVVVFKTCRYMDHVMRAHVQRVIVLRFDNATTRRGLAFFRLF